MKKSTTERFRGKTDGLLGTKTRLAAIAARCLTAEGMIRLLRQGCSSYLLMHLAHTNSLTNAHRGNARARVISRGGEKRAHKELDTEARAETHKNPWRCGRLPSRGWQGLDR